MNPDYNTRINPLGARLTPLSRLYRLFVPFSIEKFCCSPSELFVLLCMRDNEPESAFMYSVVGIRHLGYKCIDSCDFWVY